MSQKNDFKAFSIGNNANVISQEKYNDVLDDGNIEKLTAQLDSALEQKMTTDIPSASLTQKGVVQFTNVVGNSDYTKACSGSNKFIT